MQSRKKRSGRKSKRKQNREKNKIILAVCAVVLIIICVVIVVTVFLKGRSDSPNAEISGDYVEPAPGTLDIEKIQGFKEKISVENETNSDENESEKSESESSDSQETNLQDKESQESVSAVPLSDYNLKVESIGSYSGNFIEDGSDEPVSNVAAILITNNSDKMLQIAEITFQVNQTETAVFKVTNLPSGTSALVMEANKREFKEEDFYTYGNTVSGYMDQPSLEKDKFELTTEKGKIVLKNKTNEEYDKVYVYYKYVQLGGAYLGGITYRTPFENVPSKGEVESVAAHFNPGGSQIIQVQIVQK